jgi:hypothetical protein
VFVSPSPFILNPGENGIVVRVAAPDYKAAISKAMDAFAQHMDSLCFYSALQKIEAITDEFRIKNVDDGNEFAVLADVIRPFEPPPLINGNAIWVYKKNIRMTLRNTRRGTRSRS